MSAHERPRSPRIIPRTPFPVQHDTGKVRRWSPMSSRGGTRTPDPVINRPLADSLSLWDLTHLTFGRRGEKRPEDPRSSPDKSPDTFWLGDATP